MDAPRKPPRLPLADDFRPPRALDVFFAALLRPPLDQPRPLLDPPRPLLLEDFRSPLALDVFFAALLRPPLDEPRPPLDEPRPLLDAPRPPLLDDFRPRLPFDDFLEDALAAALASDRPFVLDVVCDPEVPLLPPAPRSSRRHYVMALAKRDPQRDARHTGIVEAGVRLAAGTATRGVRPRRAVAPRLD